MQIKSHPVSPSRPGRQAFLSASRTVLGLPRWAKRGVVVGIDLILLAISVWIAFFLRLGIAIPWGPEVRIVMITAALFLIPIFVATGVLAAIRAPAAFDRLVMDR